MVDITEGHEGWIIRSIFELYTFFRGNDIQETSLLSKEGKKVWFSWVNSIMPNGNYVGVGLDVTRYKNGK